MAQEYGQWPESCWTSADIDWRAAKKITAGIDIGTASSQAAILCDGALFGYANLRTGANYRQAADKAIQMALGNSGMAVQDIGAIMQTGWGGNHVACATGETDELTCHAKGARFLFGPSLHTVVDLGAQTTKAILLYDWDRVRDFMINDKCATGMGRNVEFLCDLLQIPIEEIGEKSLEVPEDPEPVSTTCYTFADTETLGLFGRPEYRSEALTEAEIYASHLFAIAWRILGLIGRLQAPDVGDIRITGDLGFTGGLAKNPGVTKRIERELGVTALTAAYDPMLAGAIGAALLAGEGGESHGL